MSDEQSSANMPQSYAEGLAELEGILDYLRGSDVDLEAMADKVERAGQLIRFCRRRLDDVAFQVNDILDSIKADLGEEE